MSHRGSFISSLRGVIEDNRSSNTNGEDLCLIWAFDIDIAMELVQNFNQQDVVGMIREVVESPFPRSSSFSSSSSSASSSSSSLSGAIDEDAESCSNLPRAVQLVMAGKNKSWTESIISELQTIQSVRRPSSFKMHKLDKAGHWVHVDDLDGLMKLMVDELGERAGTGGLLGRKEEEGT